MSRNTEFDKEEILMKAMNVFWRKGFERTSMNDLIKATGLLKGSIYNSFKSKENLFLLCLEKYAQNSSSLHYKFGDPSEYLATFFKKLVKEGADKNFTKGCMIMNSCMEFAEDETVMAKKAETFFAATERNFENVVHEILKGKAGKNSKSEKSRITNLLVAAAFSIREISKFKKDKNFLNMIANNALKELEITL